MFDGGWPEHAAFGAEAVAEPVHAVGAQARGVIAEVGIERGLILQPVMQAQDQFFGRTGRIAALVGLDIDETRQREDCLDVLFQPGAVRRFDGALHELSDFVDDHSVSNPTSSAASRPKLSSTV